MTSRLSAAIGELVDALREELSAGHPTEPDKLLSVDEAATALGVGRSKVYGELAAGRLRSLRIGDRRLVPSGAIRDYVAQLGTPEAPMTGR